MSKIQKFIDKCHPILEALLAFIFYFSWGLLFYAMILLMKP